MTSLQAAAFFTLWVIVLSLFTFLLLLYRVVDKAYRQEDSDSLQASSLPAGSAAPDIEIHTAKGLEPYPFPGDGRIHTFIFANATCGGCVRLLSEIDSSEPPGDPMTVFIIGEGMLEYADPGSASFAAHWVGHAADLQRDYNLSVVPTTYVLQGRTVLAAEAVTSKSQVDELVAAGRRTLAESNDGPLKAIR